MFTLTGRYASAAVYAESVEAETIAQVQNMLNQPVSEGSHIAIMPDCCPGAGCTIGTTMTITDRVCPNLTGADLNCGMLTVIIKPQGDNFPDLTKPVTSAHNRLVLQKLDEAVRTRVPFGFSIHASAPKEAKAVEELIADLRCRGEIKLTRVPNSVGTLGGGNHFIELDRMGDGSICLVVHTGSRTIGMAVASYYQKAASFLCTRQGIRTSADCAYLTGPALANYLHDVDICAAFADLSRKKIADEILSAMGWEEAERFTTVHNYLDTDAMVLRKGAVSARTGEKLLIPLNMRDGSLICEGKGNADWNCSAPHGAGRLLSRSDAKEAIDVEDYRDSMQGIFSTCVDASTLDESPMAYKPMDEIINQIGETVTIREHIIPLYNFKASGG